MVKRFVDTRPSHPYVVLQQTFAERLEAHSYIKFLVCCSFSLSGINKIKKQTCLSMVVVGVKDFEYTTLFY